jgi:8-oxo-dGTP pyrophosphatase MutT (NUDIX family)
MTQRGGWTIRTSQTVFENPWMKVTTHDGIRPDGDAGTYAVMSPKSYAALILPVFADGTIMLVGQPRFALDNYSWEIPEGGSPKTDPPLDGAKRELKEETGLYANCWKEILQAEVSNSLTDEQAFGYLAWDLKQGDQALEGTEEIVLKRIHFRQALEFVMSDELRDLPTIAMLLKAHHMARTGLLDADLSRAMLE